MVTSIVLGMAATVAVVLVVAVFGRNAGRREKGFAASADPSVVSWIGASGASGDCDAGATSDAGCGDGGGGGGGD